VQTYSVSITCDRGWSDELSGHLDIDSNKVGGSIMPIMKEKYLSPETTSFFQGNHLEFDVYGHVNITVKRPNSQSLIFIYALTEKLSIDLFDVSIPHLSRDLSGTYPSRCIDLACRVWEPARYIGQKRRVQTTLIHHPSERPPVENIIKDSSQIIDWPRKFNPSLAERIFKGWKWSDEEITLKLIDESEREQEKRE
jgi:hypothetical protein